MLLLSRRQKDRLSATGSKIVHQSRNAARWLTGSSKWIEGKSSFGSILSVNPAIIYTTLTKGDSTRFLWSFGVSFSRVDALVIVFLSYHFSGSPHHRRRLRKLSLYRKHFPRHRIIFACNASDEVETLRRHGESALLLNHNLTVSEAIYRPLEDVQPEFDAVYNARFAPMKRVDLAFDISRMAYVTYGMSGDDHREYVRLTEAIYERHPDHLILNEMRDGLPVFMDPAEVNRAYNRSAVGLCLSATEGAMLSSMEYMMAGLPIVSTPSFGGRDLYFDPDYALVVPADPREIREAVGALKARAIPRHYIREKTLRRVQRDREAFLGLLDAFLAEQNHEPRFGTQWPWLQRQNLCRWMEVREHVAMAESEPTGRPQTSA